MRGLLRSFPHQPTSTSVPGATPPLPPASSTPLRTVTSGAPSDQLGDQPGIPSPSQRPFTLDSAAAAVASKPSTCSNSSPHMDVHIQFRSSTPPLDKADAPREASNPDASLGGVRKDPPPGKQARAPKRAKHAPRTSVGDAPQAVDRQVGEALMALKGKAAPTLATSTPATPAGTASLHPPLSAWAAAVNAPNPPVVDPVHALTHLLASNPNTANASTAANPQIDALSQLLLHGALPPAVLEVLVGQTQQQQQGKDLIAAALGSGMLPHIPAPQPQPIAQLALGATPSAPLRPVALGSRRLSVMLPNEPSLLPPSVRSAPIPKVSSTDKDPPSAAAVVGPRESVTQLTHEARLARHPSQHPIGMDVGQPLTARGELGIWSGKIKHRHNDSTVEVFCLTALIPVDLLEQFPPTIFITSFVKRTTIKLGRNYPVRCSVPFLTEAQASKLTRLESMAQLAVCQLQHCQLVLVPATQQQPNGRHRIGVQAFVAV